MSNLNTRMPTGNDVTQRIDPKPAFSNDLFEQMLQPANLQRAWKQVRANKGAAGVDGMSVDYFPTWVKSGEWEKVKAALLEGYYHPQPVRRVEIEKPDGGKRPLGIPTVIDRVIQQAIAQVLTPIFDPSFSSNSFGFRPGRNGQQAVKQVQQIIKQKRRIAVDVDLSQFFDRVDHDLLMTLVGRRVHDKRLQQLIARYLRAGLIDNQLFRETREGVPQGGPLSPLLANIMLDPLDKELERRGHKFARYADDFIILVNSRRAGERVLRSITQYLQSRLKLVINTEKSQVVNTRESKFLGFTFQNGRIKWHPKTLQKFKQRIRQLTNRNWGVSMRYQLFKTSQFIRGWINYFGIANCYQLCCDLDHWIRRRVRMAYWRQWRKPRTKVRNLLRLGVPIKSAVGCGITSKGPWRSSKTPGINQALNDAYLKKSGLVSLRDGWIKLHYSE
ncbi:group II intron reverse transcriptase/maturase [Halomonas llamarensis]|uniref:RNA-directed DNA polymerase n=1 Tax=Halomonas llamarensis TaxID=2945104 RepID=A0ABT0STZ6_9GAMM|nr:group II intron reverse transcriptase/maturase [Halomonas llamarensis]MCL7931317.1 group II intron reverse transcriptase/maturase [Halomonas llamarensis]